MRNTPLVFIIILILVFPINLKGQTIIKMQREGGVFTVPCSLNGVKLKFIFDTGASNVSISLTEANFLFKNGYLTKEDILGNESYLDATGSISVGTKINIKKLEFSGLILNNVEASIVHKLNAPLLLGQSAMAKFGKFQFDPNNGTITILNGASNNVNSDLTLGQTVKNYINSANSKFELNDYSGAIEDYTKAIELDSNNANAFYNRANCKYRLNDYRGSLVDCVKAIELKPSFSFIYTLSGECKDALEDRKGALLDFTKAIELNPKDAFAYYNRGIIRFYYFNQKEGACLDWSKAGEFGHKDAYARISESCK